MSRLVRRLEGFGTTIFAEMSELAARTGAINLGQGFPDTDGPREVLDAAVAAIRDGRNQYPPGAGVPELRTAIARHQKRFWDLDVDADREVLVTAGATEAIAAAVLALCEPGSEVVTFDPAYDSYAATIAMAGAERRSVVLDPPGFSLDAARLEAAITPRTRAILFNSPHNPTGKVFSDAELDIVADVARRHDLLVITDEVYEHLVYDGRHTPIVSRPGMAERTVTISSAAKTFAVTGWKIGWVCAAPDLVAAVRTAKQFLTFVNGAPFQPAVAAGLDLPDAYFDRLAAGLRANRDRLSEGLAASGFGVHPSAATYFITADIRPLGADDGLAFCRSLPERCGVVAIPMSVFYADADEGRHLVRFAFCKRPDVIEAAVERLATLGSG